jgi:hypothetical protein
MIDGDDGSGGWRVEKRAFIPMDRMDMSVEFGRPGA